MNNSKLNFNYNIAEYMFAFYINKKAKLRKFSNSIRTINTTNYGNKYWEFTKKKIIWARKNDRIKNEIDYDNNIIKKMIKKENNSINVTKYPRKKLKINMFDEINKFKKYDSLDIEK